MVKKNLDKAKETIGKLLKKDEVVGPTDLSNTEKLIDESAAKYDAVVSYEPTDAKLDAYHNSIQTESLEDAAEMTKNAYGMFVPNHEVVTAKEKDPTYIHIPTQPVVKEASAWDLRKQGLAETTKVIGSYVGNFLLSLPTFYTNTFAVIDALGHKSETPEQLEEAIASIEYKKSRGLSIHQIGFVPGYNLVQTSYKQKLKRLNGGKQ